MIRFYLDEDISNRVASIVRAAGLDVLSSHDVGRNKISDDDQLRWAAGQDRCLVTRNHKHFVPLTHQFVANRWPHRGVLIVTRSLPNNDFAGIARALIEFAGRHPESLPDYAVEFLHPVSGSGPE